MQCYRICKMCQTLKPVYIIMNREKTVRNPFSIIHSLYASALHPNRAKIMLHFSSIKKQNHFQQTSWKSKCLIELNKRSGLLCVSFQCLEIQSRSDVGRSLLIYSQDWSTLFVSANAVLDRQDCTSVFGHRQAQWLGGLNVERNQ